MEIVRLDKVMVFIIYGYEVNFVMKCFMYWFIFVEIIFYESKYVYVNVIICYEKICRCVKVYKSYMVGDYWFMKKD